MIDKLLFLDIDGVLNNQASIAEGIHLIPEKCVLLREICKQLNLKIVISSSWRITYKDPSQLYDILQIVGMRGVNFIGYTPQLSQTRGHEIEKFLSEYESDYKYCIIDDNSDMLESQKAHFIQTNWNVGLTTKDVTRIKHVYKNTQ